MPRWNTRERQQLVDGYLNATRRNTFVPSEFLGWLREQPGHDLYDVFFGKSDEVLAQAMRENMVRQWVSGCRLTVRYSEPGDVEVKFTVVEQPLYVSPVAGRRSGGGYVVNDGADASVQAELRRQAATALDGWLGRYCGVAAAAGIDTAPIREIVGLLTVDVVQPAA